MHTLLKTRFGAYQIRHGAKAATVNQWLDAYFAGKRPDFTELPLETDGTVFQKQVWEALCAIPYGETIDYPTLARNVGNTQAVRAAASSNARNPISIIIPCHRVVGKDGSLRGYAGGKYRKQWLLKHEGAI